MKLTVASKLGISFGAILLLMGINAAITYSELSSMSKIQERMTTVRVPTLTETEALAKEVFHASSDLRSYALYGSDLVFAERYESSRKEDWRSAEEHLAKLHDLSKNWVKPENKQRLARITEDVKTFRRIQDEVQPNLQGHGDKARTAALEELKGGAPVAADLTATMNDLLKTLNGMVDDDRSAVMSSASVTMLVAILSTLIAVVLGAGVAVFISRQIGREVGQIHSRITDISHGDLTGEELRPVSKDELAAVVDSTNLMQRNLTEIISALRTSAEQIASASEEISSSATQVATGAEAQRNETTQVATALQEMAVTVQQVSHNSQLATEGAHQSREVARNGGAVVDSTVEAIQVLAEATRETAIKIEELGKSSDQIGRIVSVIDDIADQTNLLALNAAIEAARAGEQGRGFAVVADEVRKLAERTTQATKEIGGMITNIQAETTKAVDAMNAGLARVDAGVGTARKAGDALKEIITNAESVQEMVTQIATAATQQSAATAQVSDNMERISDMVSQSASNAQQSSAACQDLSNLALELQHVVEKFRLAPAVKTRPAANLMGNNRAPNRQAWDANLSRSRTNYLVQ